MVVATAAMTNQFLRRQAEHRHPSRGKFIEVDGVRLHYLEKGTGDPIVLIHGNGVSAGDFVQSGIFDLLAETNHVIAFDRPGFGYSQRPRLRKWTAKAQAELLLRGLAQLGIGRAVVVGHSWGTLVALNLGLDHPAAVSGLVLVSGYYAPTLRLDVVPQFGPAAPIFGDIMCNTISPLLGWLAAPMVLKQLFSPAKITESFRSGFSISMALRPSQIRANASDAAMMVSEAAKTADRHDELSMPVVIIAGTGDKLVSPEHQSGRLAREVPQSRLHRIEGAGHMVHHTAPQEVAEAIATVLSNKPVRRLPLVA